MWIYTTEGFFSITVSDRNPNLLQVRARVKADLIKFIGKTGISAKIVELHDRDYAFRVFVGRQIVNDYMANYIQSMTYSNFKNEAAKADRNNEAVSSQQSKIRMGAYHDVWAIMYRLQDKLKTC